MAINADHSGPIITVLATDQDFDWPFNAVTYELGSTTGGAQFFIDQNGVIRGTNVGML